MPIIEVDDEVYDHIADYAKRWGQTVGEALGTLVYLHTQPEHTVARPSGRDDGTGTPDGHDDGEVCR